MVNQTVAIREVDGVEIISVMDNSLDFISTIQRKEVQQVRNWIRDRMGKEWIKKYFRLPFAEHGYSVLIRTLCDEKSHVVLFDTGISREGAVTNAKGMGLDLAETESIVLSHGHFDHSGGLLKVLQAINKRDLPIIVHEDMFKVRGVANQDGTVRKFPSFPAENQVKLGKYVRTKQPHPVADNTMLVTGEIPRKTDFEKGFPQHRALIDGEWQPDPWIWDDRAIVINVKQKGLVVISGCAHAGIVNTTLYAQQITGIAKVYAVMGGFHLSGKECEPRISQTVKKLKQLNPTVVVPSHCTGWRGIYAFSEAMPQAFVWNSVGNLYRF